MTVKSNRDLSDAMLVSAARKSRGHKPTPTSGHKFYSPWKHEFAYLVLSHKQFPYLFVVSFSVFAVHLIGILIISMFGCKWFAVSRSRVNDSKFSEL